MDMGFPRLAVEHAVKMLGSICEMTTSPESIVAWLLDHRSMVDSLRKKQALLRFYE